MSRYWLGAACVFLVFCLFIYSFIFIFMFIIHVMLVCRPTLATLNHSNDFCRLFLPFLFGGNLLVVLISFNLVY